MAADSNTNNSILGVYGTDTKGKRRLVHRYQGGDCPCQLTLSPHFLHWLAPDNHRTDTRADSRE